MEVRILILRAFTPIGAFAEGEGIIVVMFAGGGIRNQEY